MTDAIRRLQPLVRRGSRLFRQNPPEHLSESTLDLAEVTPARLLGPRVTQGHIRTVKADQHLDNVLTPMESQPVTRTKQTELLNRHFPGKVALRVIASSRPAVRRSALLRSGPISVISGTPPACPNVPKSGCFSE